MKKVLLSIAFLFAISVGVNAQTISFETSEGYTIGLIEGQNGWSAAFEDSDLSYMSVSSGFASEGANSLQFTSDGSEWDYYDGPLSPALNITDSDFEISFDFYPESNGDSDHVIYGLEDDGTTLYISSMIAFNWQGNVIARVGETNTIVGTYTADQWYNVKIKYEFSTSTLTYYLNDMQIHTGSTVGDTTGVTNLLFAYDNYGSGFYIDNIVVNTTLSRNSALAGSFSVYPNPVKDVLNISNSVGAEINSVIVSDINGRTVKQVGAVSQIDIADLNAGVYFVNINSNEGSLTKKIVKQ